MSELLPSEVPETGRSSPGGAATLLYTSDTLSDLELVKLVLDSLRPAWRLLAAQDGHEGLRQARAQRPDLILLNLQLPGMSGSTVLTELRRQPETARIPVVILSADASRQTRDHLRGLGANDYFLKPLDVNVLVAKLDALWQTDGGEPRFVVSRPPR